MPNTAARTSGSYAGVPFELPTAYQLRMAIEDYDRNHALSEGQEALRDLNAHLERTSRDDA